MLTNWQLDTTPFFDTSSVGQMVMGMLKMQNPDEFTFQSINFNFYTTSAVLQVSVESDRVGCPPIVSTIQELV